MTRNRRSSIIDLPVPPDQKVTSLHAWIAIHENGGEGIISADLPSGRTRTMRHMPLMASRRDLAFRMEPLAEEAAEMSQTSAQPVVRIELRSFVLAKPEPDAA